MYLWRAFITSLFKLAIATFLTIMFDFITSKTAMQIPHSISLVDIYLTVYLILRWFSGLSTDNNRLFTFNIELFTDSSRFVVRLQKNYCKYFSFSKSCSEKVGEQCNNETSKLYNIVLNRVRYSIFMNIGDINFCYKLVVWIFNRIRLLK